ncbi:MAG: CDP-alcohol phosphatidyltransferase family protein [Candidatus Microsaccharimonas sp.]
MNLHRASSKPDWENTSPAKRTMFQRLAASTHGIITPANIVTIIGLCIVIWGLVAILQGQFFVGLLLVVGGRLLDIVDGVVAEATHTKSSVGELFDAAADKIGTLLTILVLIVANSTYWWVILALILPQVLIPLLVFYKKQKNIRVHPTRQGKISMALTWVGIAGLLLVKAFDENVVLATATYVVIAASLLLGLYALWQYASGKNQD